MSTTIDTSDWNKPVFLSSLSDIETLKNSNGSDTQVWGSSELIRRLRKNNLVDQLWLIIRPITLGKGKICLAMAQYRQHLHY